MSVCQSRESPSDHLLRTLAAVPVSSQILDLGCGNGRHTAPLLRLGFPVHACDPRPEAIEATRHNVRGLVEEGSVESCIQEATLDTIDYPEGSFDWVVAERAEIFVATDEDLRRLFEQSQHLLKPGGWLYVAVPASSKGREEASTTQRDPTGEGGRPGPSFTIEEMEAHRRETSLVEASRPTRVRDLEVPRIRAIYRRVEPHTPE